LSGRRDWPRCSDGAERNVVDIVEVAGKLHDEQTAAGEINRRLKRFLQRRNKR
jgi:hypothetical protein